jgi:hypothetical protein
MTQPTNQSGHSWTRHDTLGLVYGLSACTRCGEDATPETHYEPCPGSEQARWDRDRIKAIVARASQGTP